MSSRTAGPDGILPTPSGPGDLSYQKRLTDSQWWPADQLRLHQMQALSSLVAHAHRTVPFHRRPREACTAEA